MARFRVSLGPVPMHHQVYLDLRGSLDDRTWQPGDRLPPERELASTMGVSRSSLREALRALAMLGVAEMRQGDGTYVSSLEPEKLLRPVGLVLSLSDAGLSELFEARKLVEPGLAALAAERIDSTAAAELVRCAEASPEALEDAEAFMWNDIELHGRIARAADNAVLCRLLDSVASMGIASRRRTGRLAKVRLQSAQDHVEVAAAIAAGDAEEARAAMLRHLENVESAVNG
jgi:GntR family transcriptional repressor for pyruvate dehydrogenase complex